MKLSVSFLKSNLEFSTSISSRHKQCLLFFTTFYPIHYPVKLILNLSFRMAKKEHTLREKNYILSFQHAYNPRINVWLFLHPFNKQHTTTLSRFLSCSNIDKWRLSLILFFLTWETSMIRVLLLFFVSLWVYILNFMSENKKVINLKKKKKPETNRTKIQYL